MIKCKKCGTLEQTERTIELEFKNDWSSIQDWFNSPDFIVRGRFLCKACNTFEDLTNFGLGV